jgi:hypothetical protein
MFCMYNNIVLGNESCFRCCNIGHFTSFYVRAYMVFFFTTLRGKIRLFSATGV